MRVVAALAALMLLAGCDGGANQAPPATGTVQSDGGGAYDYRYAFRLPSDRLKAVLQSNADACDRLGPTRCKIDSMGYTVDSGSRIRAVLNVHIDPTIARAYGDAITKSVTGTDGVLVNSAITGTESTSAARSIAVIDRLRDQLKNAEAIANSDSPNAGAAKALAERTKIALEAIAESEAKQGESLATAPMQVTYESSTALTGLGSADANFRNAGKSLESSVARLLIVLASVGPWLLALIGIILILRLIVHGRGGVVGSNGNSNGHDEYEAAPQQDDRRDNRNLIQRWFARDDDEPQPGEGQPQH